MLVRMERDGWVKRVENEKDGRSFHVELTDKGRKSKNEMIIQIDNHFAAYMSEVPRDVHNDLRNELQHLRSILGDYTPVK